MRFYMMAVQEKSPGDRPDPRTVTVSRAPDAYAAGGQVVVFTSHDTVPHDTFPHNCDSLIEHDTNKWLKILTLVSTTTQQLEEHAAVERRRLVAWRERREENPTEEADVDREMDTLRAATYERIVEQLPTDCDLRHNTRIAMFGEDYLQSLMQRFRERYGRITSVRTVLPHNNRIYGIAIPASTTELVLEAPHEHRYQTAATLGAFMRAMFAYEPGIAARIAEMCWRMPYVNRYRRPLVRHDGRSPIKVEDGAEIVKVHAQSMGLELFTRDFFAHRCFTHLYELVIESNGGLGMAGRCIRMRGR